MTRENAKNWLNKLYARADITDEYGDMEDMQPYEEALDMAIQALEQEPCDEYIKVPKKALRYRTAGMVAYNAEWLKNHFDIERAVILGCEYKEQEPKTGWIPVSERLPEEGINVLVWYRYWRYGEYNNWYYTYGIGYQFDDYWSVIDGGTQITVYAWQELPKPYEPQESEE